MKRDFLTGARGAGYAAVGAALVAALPAPSQAQDGLLDEITVTASKREESVLDAPMTVDAIPSKDIIDIGALSLEDLQDFVPGFDVGSNPTQAGITIRGVSSANISTGGDPSVATFYDDIYVPRAATTSSFVDIARVEVLKGPQGTLYGRNAAAGVVNIVPNRPAPENSGFIRTRFGNYGQYRLELMGNAAVSDNIFVRASLLKNQQDGYVENLVPGGRDGGEQDNFAARVSVLWEISERTDLQVSYDRDQVDNAPRAAIGLSEWAACPLDPTCGTMLNDVIDGEETRDMWAANAKINHQINDAWSMKFVHGYREFDTVNKQDEDGTAEVTRYLDTDNLENSDISYSELQFNFSNERVNLVFGTNYSKEDVNQEIPVNTNLDSVTRLVTQQLVAEVEAQAGVPIEVLTGGAPVDHLWNPVDMSAFLAVNGINVTPEEIVLTGDFAYDLLYLTLAQDPSLAGLPLFGPSYAGTRWSEKYFNTGDFTNWGIYSDADFQATERLNLILGLRYSNDEKTFSWQNPPNALDAVRPGIFDLVFPANPGYPEARNSVLVATHDWSKVSGRAVARYQFTDSASAFLSYSTGYKSGGYDSLAVETSEFPLRPEESENVELGIKGDFLSNRLRLQLAVFSMDIEGRQRTIDQRPPGAPNPLPLINLGDETTDGVEMVVNWLPTDSLRLAFQTTWRDKEVTWDPYFDANGDPQEDLERSETNTDYTATIGWMSEIAQGNLDVRIDYIFNENPYVLGQDTVFDPADYPALLDEGFFEDRKDLRARVAWTSDDDQWTLALWGKNLLDQKRLGGVSDISVLFGTPFAALDVPRTWGIELEARF
jgi:outer membrane receptor protein involved in Fe transport